MYTYCIMFEDCREQVNRKTKPKPRHFRLFRNPGQDMSRKKRTYNHPTFISTHIYARKQNSTIILDSLEQICIHCHNNDKPCVTYLEGRLKENKDWCPIRAGIITTTDSYLIIIVTSRRWYAGGGGGVWTVLWTEESNSLPSH